MAVDVHPLDRNIMDIFRAAADSSNPVEQEKAFRDGAYRVQVGKDFAPNGQTVQDAVQVIMSEADERTKIAAISYIKQAVPYLSQSLRGEVHGAFGHGFNYDKRPLVQASLASLWDEFFHGKQFTKFPQCEKDYFTLPEGYFTL